MKDNDRTTYFMVKEFLLIQRVLNTMVNDLKGKDKVKENLHGRMGISTRENECKVSIMVMVYFMDNPGKHIQVSG